MIGKLKEKGDNGTRDSGCVKYYQDVKAKGRR